jgi:hypothetical protein
LYLFFSALKVKAEISSETLVNWSQSTFLYAHKTVFFRVTDVRHQKLRFEYQFTKEVTTKQLTWSICTSIISASGIKKGILQNLNPMATIVCHNVPCLNLSICSLILSTRLTWFDNKWLTVMAVCKSVARQVAIAVTSSRFIHIASHLSRVQQNFMPCKLFDLIRWWENIFFYFYALFTLNRQ